MLDNYKKSTFSPKKIRPLGPVHLDQISDKLDYLNCPSGQKKKIHFFSIGQATRSLGKWNWHWLNFFSFTFILAQCAFRSEKSHILPKLQDYLEKRFVTTLWSNNLFKQIQNLYQNYKGIYEKKNNIAFVKSFAPLCRHSRPFRPFRQIIGFSKLADEECASNMQTSFKVANC